MTQNFCGSVEYERQRAELEACEAYIAETDVRIKALETELDQHRNSAQKLLDQIEWLLNQIMTNKFRGNHNLCPTKNYQCPLHPSCLACWRDALEMAVRDEQ